MRRWEYKTEEIAHDNTYYNQEAKESDSKDIRCPSINNLGGEGWELVSTYSQDVHWYDDEYRTAIYGVFKRELSSK